MIVAKLGGSKRATVSDFMPKFDRQPKTQTPAQQAALFKQFVAAHNATVGRNGR